MQILWFLILDLGFLIFKYLSCMPFGLAYNFSKIQQQTVEKYKMCLIDFYFTFNERISVKAFAQLALYDEENEQIPSK